MTINGLPIINDRPNRFGFPQLEDLDQYYVHCVIGGAGAFIVVAHGFEAFARAIRRKLILEIAAAPRALPAPDAAPTRAPALRFGPRDPRTATPAAATSASAACGSSSGAATGAPF